MNVVGISETTEGELEVATSDLFQTLASFNLKSLNPVCSAEFVCFVTYTGCFGRDSKYFRRL
jgi:hypothetical protein